MADVKLPRELLTKIVRDIGYYNICCSDEPLKSYYLKAEVILKVVKIKDGKVTVMGKVGEPWAERFRRVGAIRGE